MNHSFFAKYDNVFLRPLHKDDIEKLRVWRNNEVETRFLRQIGYISAEQQNQWFESYLNRTDEIVFSIIETTVLNRCVGSLSIYDIKKDVAEIGKIQIGDNEAHHKGIGRKSLVMAMKVAFELMEITSIIASVHQDNVTARTNDLKIGFKITGEHSSMVGGMEDDLLMNITQLKLSNSFYDQIKIGSNYGDRLI